MVMAFSLASCAQQGPFETDGFQWPGDPAIYQRIEQLEDCAELDQVKVGALAARNELSRSHPNAEEHLGYAGFAIERMEELGCGR